MASSPAAWKKKSATEVSQALANKKHQQLREEDEMWASGEEASDVDDEEVEMPKSPSVSKRDQKAKKKKGVFKLRASGANKASGKALRSSRSKGDLKANAQTANLSGGERVERSMSTESSDDFSGGEGPVLASPPGSPRKSKIIEAFEQLFLFCFDFGFMQQDRLATVAPSMIVKVQQNKGKPRGKKATKALNEFLPRFLRMPININSNWAELFHHRSIEAQNVIDREEVESLERLTCHFLQSLSVEEKQLPGNVRPSEDFLEYLADHREDPDNAIIGLPPSLPYLRRFSAHVRNDSSSEFLQAAAFRKEHLLNMIFNWSELDDLQLIGLKVQDFARSLRRRGVETLKRGDLVIARIPINSPPADDSVKARQSTGSMTITETDPASDFPPTVDSSQVVPSAESCKIVYGRFISNVDNKLIVMYCTPGEDRTDVAPAEHVLPFTHDMRVMLGASKTMENLVQDAVDQLVSQLKDDIRALTLSYMDERGIDTELLKRASNNDITMRDLLDLRKGKEDLLFLYHGAKDLLNKVEAYACQELQHFYQSYKDENLFQPTKNQSLKSLDGWPFYALAKNRLQRYIGVVDGALDQLEIDKRAYLSGEIKEELSDWWLDLIADECNAFAAKCGFEFGLVPEDYAEIPPENVTKLQQNIAIVRQILDTKEDKFNTRGLLVQPLLDRIYPRVDEFVEMLTIVLVDQAFPHGQITGSFDIGVYEERLLKCHSYMKPGVSTQLLDSVKDLKYLKDMRLMETAFAGAGTDDQTLKMTHVVPLSGIIMGNFYRWENELVTVMELWGSQDDVEVAHRSHRKLTKLFGEKNLPGSARRTTRRSIAPAVFAELHEESNEAGDADLSNLKDETDPPMESPRVQVQSDKNVEEDDPDMELLPRGSKKEYEFMEDSDAMLSPSVFRKGGEELTKLRESMRAKVSNPSAQVLSEIEELQGPRSRSMTSNTARAALDSLSIITKDRESPLQPQSPLMARRDPKASDSKSLKHVSPSTEGRNAGRPMPTPPQEKSRQAHPLSTDSSKNSKPSLSLSSSSKIPTISLNPDSLEGQDVQEALDMIDSILANETFELEELTERLGSPELSPPKGAQTPKSPRAQNGNSVIANPPLRPTSPLASISPRSISPFNAPRSPAPARPPRADMPNNQSLPSSAGESTTTPIMQARRLTPQQPEVATPVSRHRKGSLKERKRKSSNAKVVEVQPQPCPPSDRMEMKESVLVPIDSIADAIIQTSTVRTLSATPLRVNTREASDERGAEIDRWLNDADKDTGEKEQSSSESAEASASALMPRAMQRMAEESQRDSTKQSRNSFEL